tara:strand:+ start:242 stop:529 length:288 start_codon:yes stop_codon:yes gene_type:complete
MKEIEFVKNWLRTNGKMSEDGKEITYNCIDVENTLKEAINYTRCCETLKDKYEIVFEDWLKDHKFEQSNNGFHKNGIEYKVNEITWMYIQDVYNL